MDPFKPFTPHALFEDYVRYETRRQFFKRGASFMGTAALGLLAPQLVRGMEKQPEAASVVKAIGPHFPPKAKQVIYLHMVGGPSQMDLYDFKPVMQEYYDKDLPDTVRMGQRLTTMTSGQARFPIAPSKYKFQQHGKCGMWVCELLPWTAKMVDDMCFIR
jgi:hypothetical protein